MARAAHDDALALAGAFVVDVEALESGSAPLEQLFEAGPGWWQRVSGMGDEETVRQDEPLGFSLRVSRIRNQLHLEGSFEGGLDCECGRCLERYRHALREDFRLVLDDAGERVPGEPESAEALTADGMCLGEELEAGLYRGPEIRLDRFFVELVSVAVPLQPMCKDDCQGLCPQCGINRNEAQCDCRGERRESPFAVLKQLELGR